MQLDEIRSQLKERLALGLHYGIQSIEESLAEHSMLKNEMVTFRSQFNDLNRIATQGVLGYDQVEIGYAKMRQGLLALIDRMEANDLTIGEELPEVQNRELQHRKENFFELVKLHLSNLEAVTVRIESSWSDSRQVDIHTGRQAFGMLYHDIFKHGFKFQRGGETLDISGFSKVFFEKNYPSLEVYMKTLGFILAYIQEEEVEQGFFNGVIRSLLSNAEIVMAVYYAQSNIDPQFQKLLRTSKIVAQRHQEMLIDSAHF